MVQSTIDKIRDTTVWRTIRKLAGVIDDQNETVANVQQQLDDFDLDGVKTEVTKLAANDAIQDGDIKVIKSDVTVLKSSVSTLGTDVNELDESVTDHERRISNSETDILNLRDEDKKLTNALPKTYTLYRNGEGKIQAQVETIDGTLFNSNVLDMIIPYQYDIISGTTERSFKLDITMSDGSKYTTNDFIIPAGGGTEIVVTGITLAKDSTNINRFHVGINLSDGTMIDSGFISMVDNVVATYADSKLTVSVNGVSSVPVAIDTPTSGLRLVDGSLIRANQLQSSDIEMVTSVANDILTITTPILNFSLVDENTILKAYKFDQNGSGYYTNYMEFTNEFRNKLASILLTNITLNDGTYRLDFAFCETASITSQYDIPAYGKINVNISDGEIINTSSFSDEECYVIGTEKTTIVTEMPYCFLLGITKSN